MSVGKCKTVTIALLLALAVLTSCSQTETNRQATSVSEGAVSQNVTGSAVIDSQKEKTEIYECIEGRFTNENNRYSDEEKRIVQWTKNKKKVRTYDMDSIDIHYVGLCGVTNEWLYYLALAVDFSGDCLYRVPIEKGKKGDVLNFKKKEELFHKNMIWDDMCVFDSCIIYCAAEEGDEWEFGGGGSGLQNFYRYDLNTKKNEPLGMGAEFDSARLLYYDEWEEFPVMLQGKLLIQTLDDGLYTLEPESGKVEFIGYLPTYYTGSYWLSMVKCDDSLYFKVDDGRLGQYDGQKLTYRDLNKNIRDMISKYKPWGKEKNVKKYYCFVSTVLAYKDRLYLPVIVEWTTKDKVKGKSVVRDHTKCMLMSTSASEDYKLRYERKIKPYLWEDTDIIAIQDGNLIIEYNAMDFYSLPYYASYNIDTGKYKKISEKEAEDY